VQAEVAAPNRDLPYLAVCGAVLAWGLGPLIVRAITASAVTIAFYRLWLAVPVALVVARVAGSSLSWRVLKRTAPAGVLFGASILLGFVSFQQTSVANATLIPALQPVLVVLVAGRLFGERAGRRELLLGAASLVGISMVVVFAAGGGGASPVGDLFAVGNLLAFTTYFLVVKQLRSDNMPAGALLAGVILSAAIAVTPVALLTSHDLGAVGGPDWFWLVVMVVVPGTIGHGLMNWAQRYVDVTVSSLMTLANPVVSSIGAWLIYDEVLNGPQILGAAIVLASLAGIVIAQQRIGDVAIVPEPT
jgi:drug/metabolite transporter (DMT)-like permease